MQLKDAKILIGDDSILARKQLKDVLTSLGATRFVEAVNGNEAVEKFIAEQGWYLRSQGDHRRGLCRPDRHCIFCRYTASAQSSD